MLLTETPCCDCLTIFVVQNKNFETSPFKCYMFNIDMFVQLFCTLNNLDHNKCTNPNLGQGVRRWNTLHGEVRTNVITLQLRQSSPVDLIIDFPI